jgi:hypothetical protein
MDKVRVYELARELGITSPETIRLLKEKVQVRVKSASSTVEEDVAIKLKRLIRLEGTGTVGAEEEAVDTGESKAPSAAKRRAWPSSKSSRKRRRKRLGALMQSGRRRKRPKGWPSLQLLGKRRSLKSSPGLLLSRS